MKIAHMVKTFVAWVKHRVEHLISATTLEYAPDGWNTVQPQSSSGWNAPTVVAAENEKWLDFCDAVNSAGPLGFSHEHTSLLENRSIPFHNVHITYGYVLALAAHRQSRLTILDYGGGLGHYFQLGKQLIPEVTLDFNCKEVPAIVAAGKNLNPEISWHVNDECLDNTYDLVMVNGSLQYMKDWPQFLRQVSQAAGKYFFLTRVPVVEQAGTFVAVQRVYETRMLHCQFNIKELLAVMEGTGLTMVREFVVGDRPYIHNAPEQCELRGWLFKRTNQNNRKG